MYFSFQVQEDSQWIVGRVLEGVALEDKRLYQQLFRKSIDQNFINQLQKVY